MSLGSDLYMDMLTQYGLPWVVSEENWLWWNKMVMKPLQTPCYVVDEAKLEANLQILAGVEQ